MLFEDTNGTKDKLRIIMHLNLGPDDGFMVETAMRGLERKSGDLVTYVRDLLNKLDAVSTSIDAERATANSALIKADVLEYTPDSRTKGMLMSKRNLMISLGRFLGIQPNLRQVDDDLRMIGVHIPFVSSLTVPLYRN